MNIVAQKYIDRFWGNVDKEKSKTSYDGKRCWEWTAGCTSTGYGQFLIEKKKYKPHRISYFLYFGELPDDLGVLHHCDNPVCVRPDHLFLGTPKENMNDKVSKGRQSHGENHYASKLSDKQIDEIRRRYKFRDKTGNSGRDLAREFGVVFQTISDIVRRKSHS